MTRIAVGGFLHETNTFAPTKASYDAFVHGGGWPAMWPAPIALALLSGFFFWRAWSVMKDMQVKA